jgi:hypothetical protein
MTIIKITLANKIFEKKRRPGQQYRHNEVEHTKKTKARTKLKHRM